MKLGVSMKQLSTKFNKIVVQIKDVNTLVEATSTK
jgi:hypothetical protein